MKLDLQWLETGHAILTVESGDDEESISLTIEMDEERLLEMLALLVKAKAKMDEDAQRAQRLKELGVAGGVEGLGR